MIEPIIISDPDVMLGKPIIQGTRITVELILRKMAAGQTIDRILQDYPYLKREGIVAALEFAAESVRVERVHPIEKNQASA